MSNLSNISYLNSLLLENIRTTYLTDALKLYFIVPIAIIGSYLNYKGLKIFIKKSFRNLNIFKLMFIYNIISFCITFITIFYFLYTPHILFEISVSKIGRIYSCNFINWFNLFFFFYGNCIDVLINLERAVSFSRKFEKLKKTSPYLICFVVLIICLVIHLPINLSQSFTPDNELYTKLRLCHATTYTSLSITRLVLTISIIIEGPVVMILVIGSNLLAFISYRSFLKRKEETARTINNNRIVHSTLTDIQQQKNDKMNQKLLKMTIFLTLFSVIIHIIQFGAQIITSLFNTSNKLVFAWAFFIFSFVAIFKHFFTVFFYYLFNYKFKNFIQNNFK